MFPSTHKNLGFIRKSSSQVDQKTTSEIAEWFDEYPKVTETVWFGDLEVTTNPRQQRFHELATMLWYHPINRHPPKLGYRQTSVLVGGKLYRTIREIENVLEQPNKGSDWSAEKFCTFLQKRGFKEVVIYD